MGRPLKKGLHYFNIDCNQDDNLNYIEAKHGLIGYGIVVKLWRKIYMTEGYYTEWNEKNIYLFAREINVYVDIINKVVESCFDEKIFNIDLFTKYQVLTSKGIQRRYIKIVTEARRKDCEIEQKFNILEFPHEKEEFTPEETKEIPAFSTQKKVKESKLTESKIVAAHKSPPPKAVKKKIEEPEPFWDLFVAVWFEFGIQKFGVKPSFERDDPKILKRIIQRLKKRAAEKKVEWNQNTGPHRLNIFLEMAYSDKWISENFLLSNLEKQFDKIIQNQAFKKMKSVAVTDLQYLFERFCENELDNRLIVEKHYEDLHKKNLVNIDHRIIQKRMASLAGGNQFSETELYKAYAEGKACKLTENDKPVLMKLAVIEYFKKLKSEKLQSA